LSERELDLHAKETLEFSNFLLLICHSCLPTLLVLRNIDLKAK